MQALCAIATHAGLNICNKDVFNLTVSPVVEQKFASHVAQFGHSFGTTEEYQFRLEQFAIKEAKIAEINNTNGGSFTVGHNQFSTWTDAEYKAILGYNGPKSADASNDEKEPVELDVTGLPTSIDWRSLGAVNPVQN
jgi:hypothetical protein